MKIKPFAIGIVALLILAFANGARREYGRVKYANAHGTIAEANASAGYKDYWGLCWKTLNIKFTDGRFLALKIPDNKPFFVKANEEAWIRFNSRGEYVDVRWEFGYFESFSDNFESDSQLPERRVSP
jgi:hypothetical protein